MSKREADFYISTAYRNIGENNGYDADPSKDTH